APEGCRDRRAEARRQEYDREAPAERQGPAELRPQLLLPERQGRVRRRGDVRVDLRGVHGEGTGDGEDGCAVRREGDRLAASPRLPALGFRLGGLKPRGT